MDELSALRAFRADVPPPTDDVRAAARVRMVARRRRRPALVAAVSVALIALAAVVVTAALGVGPLGFVVGDPAPPAVREEVALRDAVGAAVTWFVPSGVDADELRLLRSLETRVGRVYVWTAPLESGDRCTYIHVPGRELAEGRPDVRRGPCSSDAGFRPLIGRHRRIEADGRATSLVEGWVRSGAAGVEVGVRGHEPRSRRVADGFFFVELPPGVGCPTDLARRAGPSCRDEVTIFPKARDGAPLTDRGGRPVALTVPLWLPIPLEQIGPAETIIEIETSAGVPASLLVAPGEDGSRCVYLKFQGTGGGCNRYDGRGLTVSPSLFAEGKLADRPVSLLQGYAPPGIEAVEVRYYDGSRERVRLEQNFFLHEPRSLIRVVVGLDADGRELARVIVPGG